jgi:hypothetical protein
VKAKAFKNGWSASDILESTYTITGKVATPTISLNGGSFTAPQQVTISCSTPEATLYYRIGEGNWIQLTGNPAIITLNKTASKLMAMAVRQDWIDSDIVESQPFYFTYRLHVKPSSQGGSDNNDGFSWTQAKATINGAISACGGSDDEIWVASGTYQEYIIIPSGVALYGGFSGNETICEQRDWIKNETILDGQMTDYPIATLYNAWLDGFTIQNGQMAISCEGNSTVVNNKITNIVQDENHQGVPIIQCEFWSDAVISNNYIVDNSLSSIESCSIRCYSTNSAVIINNTIADNIGTTLDVVIDVMTSTGVLIANNIISFNTGIGIRVESYSPILSNNCLFGNDVNYSGVSSGDGDIYLNPLFADKLSGNYHLANNSPCIDTGNSFVSSIPTFDIDLEGRIFGESIDIGADEYWSSNMPISSIKAAPDWATVRLEGAAVSAAFNDFFYVEADNRSSGIRVDAVGHALEVGDKADVKGRVKTNSSGEVYIEATEATQDGSGTVAPLNMNGRTVGGGSFGNQAGITGACGWNNIGILVRICGNVTQIDPNGSYFYIDDGSGLMDGTQTGGVDNVGVRLLFDGRAYDAGDHLMVTGISSCFKVGSDIQRLVRVRSSSDIESVTTGTTVSLTLYPNTDGSTGENWFSLPCALFDPDPLAVFGSASLIENLLIRLDAHIQGQIAWSQYTSDFGSLLLGDGFIYINETGSPFTVGPCSAFPEGLPCNGTSMTDACVSLPGMEEEGIQGGDHWVALPFNHTVEFEDILVTDGIETIPVLDAISRNWLDGYWTTLDNQYQGQYVVDPDGYGGPAYLEPYHMYMVPTHKLNLALIIPAY